MAIHAVKVEEFHSKQVCLRPGGQRRNGQSYQRKGRGTKRKMGKKYTTFAEVFDFGPHISKVILETGEDLKGAELSKEQFEVSVKRTAVSGEDFVWPVFMGAKPDDSMKGTRKITELYVSDKQGNPKEDGKHITLCMYCDPREGIGSVIRFDGQFNVTVHVAYRIVQKAPIKTAAGMLEGMVFDENGGNCTLYGDLLQVARHEDPEIPLSYCFYRPKEADDHNVPLLIWLHGAGEGGQEPLIAATGNKVVNLISPGIQEMFGGAYLLAPQTPTMWMNDGSGEYTKDGSSMYVEPLERLIADFIDGHEEIDRNRIYLGGDSNGGFMTMKMLLHNPDRYAAAFPVCEALADSAITDEDIASIAGKPIWFTHAKDDPVVAPDQYVVPTYKRLIAAGGKNIHFTFWDHIVDMTGKYFKEDGTPYTYIGHWAWIPMLNDQCTTDFDGSPVLWEGRPVSIIEWIAAQRLDV